jgi:hypothetical protein
VATKNSDSAEKSRVLRWSAIVSPACISTGVLLSRFLLADSAVGPFWNWRTSPSVTNCTFFVASDEVGHLLWVWLYRIWPRCLKAMELVKPSTVIQWHRQGFRLFWRWRSRSGRPLVDGETRDLIRQMNAANPIWGAPRIHGELLKLGIEISQATVAKYMVRRPGTPSPTWRTFLRNQAEGIVAIDMFVVASASFRLLYVMIVLAHDRRRIIHTAVTEHPSAAWLSRQVTEAFPWDTAPRYLLRDRDASYGQHFRRRVDAMGIAEVVTAPRSPWQNSFVERLIGLIHRECLDHLVIFNGRHLRRALSSYID